MLKPFHRGRFALPTLLTATAVVLQPLDRSGLLRYQRTALEEGEWWRLLTAHLVHLGVTHLLLNLLGLWVVWAVVGRVLGNLRGAVALLCSAISIDAGLWWLQPRVEWYVGLSGVLHGLLVAGGLALVRDGERRLGWLLFGAVAAKVAWEQFHGVAGLRPEWIGGQVIVAAHLYGAAGALLALPAWRTTGSPRRPA